MIDDFISPSILERLSSQEGVLAPQVTDWRSMVDSVMIDVAYDGEVFNVAAADIPARKTDVVEGSYEVSLAEDSSAPLAVKIHRHAGRRGARRPGSLAAGQERGAECQRRRQRLDDEDPRRHRERAVDAGHDDGAQEEDAEREGRRLGRDEAPAQARR